MAISQSEAYNLSRETYKNSSIQAFKHSNPFNLPSLKRTAKGPENGWLEDDSFPFGASSAYFQGLSLAVSFREGMGFIGVFPKKVVPPNHEF